MNRPNLQRSRAGFIPLLREALTVALASAAFAVVANWISPRGLSLSRDYFAREVSPTTAPVTNATALSNTASPSPQPVATWTEHDLERIDLATAQQLFNDPRRAQERIVFVDARADREYAKGHIPGAFQLDHYYPERYLPNVLPVCQTAERIVVYCNGGDCEDSIFTAILLGQAGVPKTNLCLYAGGITEWMTRGLPIESAEPQANAPEPRSP